MRPIALLLLTTGAAALPGQSREQPTRLQPAVALDAAGHASNLLRHEATAGQDPVTLEEQAQEKPYVSCTPAMLEVYQSKVSKKSTNPHPAGTLPDSGSLSGDDPCAKLATRLTPELAYGHVVITEPDGNVSQVPGPDEEDPEEESIKDQAISKAKATYKYYLKCMFYMFWVVLAAVLIVIIITRYSQDSQARRIQKDRDRAIAEGAEDGGDAVAAATGGSAGKAGGPGAASGAASAAAAAPKAGAATASAGAGKGKLDAF